MGVQVEVGSGLFAGDAADASDCVGLSGWAVLDRPKHCLLFLCVGINGLIGAYNEVGS